MNALVEHLTRVMGPDELREILQVFGGQHVYLPRPGGCRELQRDRNNAIVGAHAAGAQIRTLARRHGLSCRQIERILQRLEAA